jgi:type II secretory ATPase GspE/PulE/Tfp pilus assembly ATPase PilB-like protein
LCECSKEGERVLTEKETSGLLFSLEQFPAIDPVRKRKLLSPVKTFRFQKNGGCPKCKGTGIKQSIPVNGVLVLNYERRQKLNSEDKAERKKVFEEAEFRIEEQLIDLILSGRVSPLEF